MDITPYVDSLRRDLVAASEAGSDELKQAAERLAYALDPSARLALMEAISHAAAEITAELPDGSVDVRLVGRELDFVVEVAPPAAMPAPPPPPAPPAPRGGGGRRPGPDHPPHPRGRQGPGRGEGGRGRAEPQHLDGQRGAQPPPTTTPSTSTSTSAASPSSATTRSPATAGRDRATAG